MLENIKQGEKSIFYIPLYLLQRFAAYHVEGITTTTFIILSMNLSVYFYVG